MERPQLGQIVSRVKLEVAIATGNTELFQKAANALQLDHASRVQDEIELLGYRVVRFSSFPSKDKVKAFQDEARIAQLNRELKSLATS